MTHSKATPVIHKGTTRYRLAVTSRVLAACVGGYVVASLLSALLAQALPLVTGASRADGVLIATLLAFVFYTVAALWVFSTRSATGAWLGLVGVSLVCDLLMVLLPRAG